MVELGLYLYQEPVGALDWNEEVKYELDRLELPPQMGMRLQA